MTHLTNKCQPTHLKMQISSIYPKKNTFSCKVRSIIEAFVCALITARDSAEFFVNHLRCESLTHFKSLLESFSHETNYSQLNLFFANFSRKTSLASRRLEGFSNFFQLSGLHFCFAAKVFFHCGYQDELQSLSRELGKYNCAQFN